MARAVLTAENADAEPVDREEVMRRARLLSQLFKHEFVYQGERSFDEIFDETVARLDGWGLRSDARGLVVNPAGRLELGLLTLLLHDFVEASPLTSLVSLRNHIYHCLGVQVLVDPAARQLASRMSLGKIQR